MESTGIEPAITGLQDQRLPDLSTTPNRSGGDRTHDILFVREALLPLSYAPKKSDWETWIRTTIDRVRICHPANYTISQFQTTRAAGGSRTHILPLTRRLLHPLSYD